MKRARTLVLVIAVVAACGAALMARHILSAPPTVKEVVAPRMDTTRVLVANKSIGLGDSVKSEDLKWQEWPKNAAIQGYITETNDPKALSSFSGAIARAPFLEGEPIKEQKLIKASEGGVMAAILKKGMRAISTPIREETAAGGFILPNDHVDVVLSRRITGQRREDHVSETVLRNVRVLAIGQNIEIKDGKKSVNGKTATLELTPRQVEILALAQSMGDLSLSLRALSDSKPGASETSDANLGNSRGSSVKMLKYGTPSQAFGIN